MFPVFRGQQFIEVFGADAGGFVFAQFSGRFFSEGINHKHLLKFRCIGRIRFLFEVVFSLPVVQFFQSFTVFSQPDVKQFIVLPEFASGNRPNTFLLRLIHQLRNTHGGIDVGQRNSFHTVLNGQIKQFVDA